MVLTTSFIDCNILQNIVGLQPQNAHNRQQADFVPSADQPGAEDGKHAAFDVILQGVVQVRQRVHLIVLVASYSPP